MIDDLRNSKDVLRALGSLANRSAPLILSCSYKGINLSQEIKIVQIQEDQVICRVPDRRVLGCLQSRIILYSQWIDQTISANIADLNTGADRIVLNELRFTGNTWKQRCSERIQPKKAIYVDVHFQGGKVRADLDNLSMTGLKLVAYKLIEKGIALQHGNNVRISLALPDDQDKMDLRGIVLYDIRQGQLVKLGVKIYPTGWQFASLRAYITRRKTEIMDALREESYGSREYATPSPLYY